MFHIEQGAYILKKAKKVILAERNKYKRIYEIIEKYIGENKILVGGDLGLTALLNKPRDINDFTYVLYATDAFRHANTLANKLAAEQPEITDGQHLIVSLKTHIANQAYFIEIDGRRMIKFVRLIVQKNVNPIDIIEPVKRTIGDNELLILSSEMQLIDLYRTLYSPQLAGEWEETVEHVEELHKLMEVRVKTIGAAPDSATRQDVRAALMKEYIPQVLLIGQDAVNIITKSPEDATGAIQVISERPIEADFDRIKKIVAEVDPELPVQKYTNHLRIMNDFRLKRTTIKIGKESSRSDILYIYNSGQYDLIPYVSDAETYVSASVIRASKSETSERKTEAKLGNIHVLIRFLLVDLWIIRWIRGIGSIDNNFAQARIQTILGQIEKLRHAQRSEKGDFCSAMLETFQRHAYVGVLDPEDIAEKRRRRLMKKSYPEYMPALRKAQTGEFRQL